MSKNKRYCHYCNNFTENEYTIDEFKDMEYLCEKCLTGKYRPIYNEKEKLVSYIMGYPGEKTLDVLVDMFLYYKEHSESCYYCANLTVERYCPILKRRMAHDNWCKNHEVAKVYPMVAVK